MANVLCVGTNSVLLDKYLATNSSLSPQALQLRRKRQRNKKEETKLPEVSSPRGRPNRSSAVYVGR